jgi:hypothetical protein
MPHPSQVCVRALANLCALVPDTLGPLYAARIPWLMSWITNDSEVIRYHVSRVIGTASAGLPLTTPASVPGSGLPLPGSFLGPGALPHAASVVDLLGSLVAMNAGGRSDLVRFQHGGIAAMGHVLAVVLSRLRAATSSAVPVEGGGSGVSVGAEGVSDVMPLVSSALQVLFRALGNKLNGVCEVCV